MIMMIVIYYFIVRVVTVILLIIIRIIIYIRRILMKVTLDVWDQGCMFYLLSEKFKYLLSTCAYCMINYYYWYNYSVSNLRIYFLYLRIGPIDASLKYETTVSRSGYAFSSLEGQPGFFRASKLAEIIVKVGSCS